MARPGVRITYILMGFALLLSIILVFNSLGVFSSRGGEFHNAKKYAYSLLEYNLDTAESLGIPENNAAVNLHQRRLLDSINNAATPEDLYHIILSDMISFEQIIREQAEFNLTNWLEWIIIQDANVNSLDASTEVTISFLADQNTTIEGGDFLHESTRDTISTYSLPRDLRLQTVTIAVDVSEGMVMTRVKEPLIEQDPLQHMQNQFKFLEQEYNNLAALAGYSQLSGPGIIINLMDAEEDIIFSEDNIIHDIDVQEVVHSLFASGALGISVGDRRIVANTSIRCVGGPILVNYVPIPVKPLVIKAVGDPESMYEFLEPLLRHYMYNRSLRVEVSFETDLQLPGQSLR